MARLARGRQARERTGTADGPDFNYKVQALDPERLGKTRARPDSLNQGAVDTSVWLIIATRGRCSQLVRCLQSAKSITFERPWELIIVDNGSTDETTPVVREFIDSASVPVHCVF
jgi:hypothetical protein